MANNRRELVFKTNLKANFMSKKNSSKLNSNLKKNKIKLVSFWSIISLFTVAFVVILIVLLIEIRPFEKYEDIKEADLLLVGNQLFENQEKEYFVYIFTSDMDNNKIDSSKAEELKPIVFNYFNFVRQNSRKDNVIKIFGFDVSNYNNSIVVSTEHSSQEAVGFENFKVKERDLPILIKISDGQIATRNIAIGDVQKSLDSAISIIKEVSQIVILPKKEDFLTV